MTPAPRPHGPWWAQARAWLPRTVAWVTLLCGVAVSVAWVADSEQQRQQLARTQALQVAESFAHDLRLALDRNLVVLDVMAALVHQTRGDVPDFQGTARQLLASRPEVGAIGLLPGGRVADAWPPAMVQRFNGMQVLSGPGVHAGAVQAVREGRLVISEPTLLPLGSIGLAVHQPVFLGAPLPVSGMAVPTDQQMGFWGLVRVGISLQALLDVARLSNAAEHGLHLVLRTAAPGGTPESPQGVLSTSLPPGEMLVDPVSVPVRLYNLDWQLQLAPVKGWQQPSDWMFKALWAALFSLGASGLVYLLVQRLQLTRSLLQSLTDHVPGALYRYRQTAQGDAHFEYVSPGIQALTGLSPEELRASDLSWREQLVPEDLAAMREQLAASARNMTPFMADFRMRLPSGETRWLWTRSQPERNPDGSISWHGYMADWTAEKNTQEALSHSGRLLAEAQEVANLGYFITDTRTGRWTSSALLDQILGIDDSFARTAAGWAALVEPEHREQMRQAYGQAVVHQGGFNMEYSLRRPKDDRVIWVHVMGRLEFDDKGEPLRIVGTVQDISARKKAEADIRHLAYYDPLTGLPNRRLLMERLELALSQRQCDGKHGALMFIDLDNFKDLNDTQGHEKGDALLRMVALRLLSCVRETDTVARLGGDEFVLLMSLLELAPGEDPVRVAEAVGLKVVAALGRPYPLAGGRHTSTPSIGVALFADEGLSVDEVLKRADVAMYQAKAAGRNTLRFFDPGIQAEVAQRLQMAEDLRLAMSTDQLFLHYQPQHDDCGQLVGAEALLRWKHPLHGLVSPAVFIPLAEQNGLMETLGQWVLHHGCQQLRRWLDNQAMAGWTPGFTLAVNVSAHQFRSATIVADVARAIAQAHLPPGVLKLELTESLMVHDVEDIIAKMNAIRPLGVLFSLDDFGTGYSSLTYLKRLPLDQLKIDQSFVRDVITSTHDAAIARTVVALGQTLGLEVIAEGVETTGQRDHLLSIGCHVYQGYLFSKPLVEADFVAYALAHPVAQPGQVDFSI